MAVFRVGTKNYETDVVLVKKALSQMESLLVEYNGYVLGKPSSRLGWTFFTLSLKAGLETKIENRFADMIRRYRWGKPEEKLAKFMHDYFQARGCNTDLKLE